MLRKVPAARKARAGGRRCCCVVLASESLHHGLTHVHDEHVQFKCMSIVYRVLYLSTGVRCVAWVDPRAWEGVSNHAKSCSLHSRILSTSWKMQTRKLLTVVFMLR